MYFPGSWFKLRLSWTHWHEFPRYFLISFIYATSSTYDLGIVILTRSKLDEILEKPT
jgi:hypothetical protein